MTKQRRLPGSLAEQAYNRIREKILRGDFALGAALSRRALAVELGMSSLPVSEAIKALEADGLVESRPRAGTRVRIPTTQDLRDRCILREALEVQSARLFAEKASSSERLELRAMAARLDTMAEQCSSGESDKDARFRFQMYHLTFHMRIAECAGCAALCKALEQNQVLIFNWLYDVASDHSMPPGWHQELMRALGGSDPQVADAAMRRHVRYGFDEIQAELACHFGTHVIGSAVISNNGAWRVKVQFGKERS